MNVGSLFTGCGGLDLGLHAAGYETAWACESDPACVRVLAARWPGLLVVPDVREVDAGLPAVDVLAGGFPCQDLSYAGKGAGLDGARSGLWFEYARAIRVLRPRHVIVENVGALANRGLGRMLADMAEAGYVGSWLCVRASDVGAPHRRERLFILASLADPDSMARPQRGALKGRSGTVDEPGAVERAIGLHSVDWGVYDEPVHRWERVIGRLAPLPVDDRRRLDPRFVEWMLGFPEGWVDVPGVTRTAQLRMLGNSVQVQVGEVIGRLLLDSVRVAA